MIIYDVLEGLDRALDFKYFLAYADPMRGAPCTNDAVFLNIVQKTSAPPPSFRSFRLQFLDVLASLESMLESE